MAAGSWQVLLSAFITAFSFVLISSTLSQSDLSALLFAVITNIFGGLALLLESRRNGKIPFRDLKKHWGLLLAITFFAFGFGNWLTYFTIDHLSPVRATLFAQFQAVIVMLLAVVLFKERWTARKSIVLSLAVSGILLINFDPTLLSIHFGWVEWISLMAPFSYAMSTLLSKPLFADTDPLFLTAIMLLLGAGMMAPFIPDLTILFNLEARIWRLALINGLLYGLAWWAYSRGLQQAGPAATAIIYLSTAVFSFILQLVIANIWPDSGVKPPENILLTIIGGGLIIGAVVVRNTRRPRLT